MWTNGTHFEVGGQPAIRIFSPKHVEVIEPEIRHHLLKLSLAMNGTNNILCLEFLQNPLGNVYWPHLQPAGLSRSREFLEQVGCRHPNSGNPVELRIRQFVVNAVWMELGFEVFFGPEILKAFQVPGTWAES